MNLQSHGQSMDRIAAPIEAYVAGLKNADAAALERAFDAPHAPVIFVNNGQALYSPISAAIPKWIAGGPLADGEISSTLLGMTVLSETLCVATCQMRLKAAIYRDTLVLGRIGGAWKIISKSFVKLEAGNG